MLPIEKILPITAMKGVDRTASASYGVKDSVTRTTDVVEGLPESARGQLLLLLADMEEAEKLPSQVREQTALLIQDIDEHRANLQQTLDKTRETAAALDHSLGEARTTIETLERTASAITTTAEQWQSAATATEAVVT